MKLPKVAPSVTDWTHYRSMSVSSGIVPSDICCCDKSERCYFWTNDGFNSGGCNPSPGPGCPDGTRKCSMAACP
jgi:hypothetical protein